MCTILKMHQALYALFPNTFHSLKRRDMLDHTWGPSNPASWITVYQLLQENTQEVYDGNTPLPSGW